MQKTKRQKTKKIRRLTYREIPVNGGALGEVVAVVTGGDAKLRKIFLRQQEAFEKVIRERNEKN